MAEIHEGTVIDGRYRALHRIGSGGMADVWCVEDSHLQRRVALKVLHHRFAQDREFVERFRREAEAAAGLQHPNVVGVFDRGEFDRTYYIAMEFLEGQSLKELIDGGLSPGEAVAIVRQILEAARFAHRNGVIHRDLKPQNVIVDGEGKATVTDFGIARAGVSEITQTGSVMGTAHYLSPEQAQGLEVTAASDLYSIGVILYEALTGSVPFEGDSAVAALDAAQRDPGAPLAGTTEFAPPPPAVVAESGEEDEEREEERRRRQRWVFAALAILLGILAGLALTRDTTTDVPEVSGDPLGVAVDRLQEEGFEVEDIRRVQRPAPRNQVLEQDPSGEATLDCALLSFFCSKPEVTLTVSAGPGTADVPPVRGLTREAATARLEEEGFRVDVETASSSTVQEGLVISTDPSAGSTIRRGSVVTMTVSSGPRIVTVPPIVGRNVDAARQALRGRGLESSVSFQESEEPQGRVLSQSPAAGDRVEVGTTVSLVVSEGIATVRMPNVIGDERRDAVTELRRLGLSVTVTEVETDVEAQDGRVTDQFPPPGTEVREGDSVTIRVGDFVPPESPTVPLPEP
jgi:serine/threonine-protein kinase